MYVIVTTVQSIFKHKIFLWYLYSIKPIVGELNKVTEIRKNTKQRAFSLI